ncbi:Inward rectifier potassium channel Irk [Flavobacterium jejuense]|uniref:Inward rectifier potassium channel Irk n=1 Tax=Flavobacterium jejuense TaxID=1544455 RepID=A0ABX0IRE9_9FLAO|nr:ion channel [Flavobacterium jejuense]NHN24701.1 Inward rectifier potassium channel Irk [Flavobacterium jejuense]
MALFKTINSKAKTINSSGFGTNASNYGGRFVNKNGDANVKKKGIALLESISWHHFMLNIPRWHFLGVIVLFYFVANLFFASIYYWIGVENLNGIVANTNLEKFGQAFFFSIQTYTTVGYGHINPTGFWASFVSSIEALTGLLTFAIATGLFYGRFSKPQAFVKFSENAVIAPYENGTALMLRMTPFKNANLTDAEARLTLGLSVEENGIMVNKFYQLPLELDKVNALTLSWTLVHPITEKSPLYNFTAEDYASIEGEILVFIKVFDDIYSTHLVKRTSYIFKEVVYGAKFNIMYNRNEDDSKTILDLQKLNSFEKVTLP